MRTLRALRPLARSLPACFSRHPLAFFPSQLPNCSPARPHCLHSSLRPFATFIIFLLIFQLRDPLFKQQQISGTRWTSEETVETIKTLVCQLTLTVLPSSLAIYCSPNANCIAASQRTLAYRVASSVSIIACFQTVYQLCSAAINQSAMKKLWKICNTLLNGDLQWRLFSAFYFLSPFVPLAKTLD